MSLGSHIAKGLCFHKVDNNIHNTKIFGLEQKPDKA